MEAMSNKPKQPLAGPRLLFDIESNGLLEKMTKIHCIVAIDLDTLEVHRFTAMDNTIAKGLELLSSASLLVGHNIICFDLKAIQKLYPEWKPKQGCVIRDTLVYSRLAYGNLKELDFSFLERGLLSKDTFVIWDKAKQQPKSAVGSHSLEAWGVRLKCAKDDFGHTTDWQEFTSEMLEYCVQDCQTNLVLWNKLETKEVPEDALELEMAAAEILHRQELRGWAFDLEKAHVLYGKLCQRREELAQELAGIFPGWYLTMKKPEYYQVEISHKTMADASPWVIRDASKANLEDIVYKQFKGREYYSFTRAQVKAMITEGPLKKKHIAFNPGSAQHVYRALKDRYNWVPKEFTPTGIPEVNEKVLLGLASEYPEAKVLLELEIINDRIEKLAGGRQGGYLAFERNGRQHCYMNSLGCVTGRCSHNNPNLGQVPSLKPSEDYPDGKPFSREFRELFTVGKGFSLLGTDAEGQELRCLGHFMYPYDNGAYATAIVLGDKALGTDVHTLNQKAAGLPTRDLAKTFVYGFLYGAGDEKVGSIVDPKAPPNVKRSKGKKLKQQFLKATPAIQKLRDAIVSEAEANGYIKSLDGRRIPIRSSHAALNSLLQSTGAILSKRWMLFVDQMVTEAGLGEHMWQVSFIHDELNWEVRIGYEERLKAICKEAMKRTEAYYNFRCALDAGVAIGDNWYAVH
jgi:DNA polymerase-1